jgi:hypothetical protein
MIKIKLCEAERQYLQREIYNNKDRYSMWKAIRNCIPRKEATQPVYTWDIKLLANEFNEFFTTVGNDLGISQMTFTSFDSFITDEFILGAVSLTEIRKIL